MATRSLRVSPVVVGLVAAALASPALAIPAPDVLVNLFSNAAHLLALAGASLGSLFLLRGKDGRSRLGGTLVPVLTVLLGAALVANWIQHRENQKYLADKTRRLNESLLREFPVGGRVVRDVALNRSIMPAEQKAHPCGIDRKEAAALLAGPAPPPLIDVRESEEREMAWLPGSVHVRFPDLLAHPEKWLERGKKTVAFCHNGHRSWEIVELLRPKGYDLHFIRGGYLAWHKDDLPREGPGANRDNPRDIADYSNYKTILDTDQVLEAMARGKVVLLDNRYENQFEYDHLPGAINIVFRRMETPEMEKAIGALPRDAAFVNVCYDRRTSFFATCLGSKLVRSGRTYLGRYTTPYEFPHNWEELVKERQAALASAGRGFLGGLSGPIEWLLSRSVALAGSAALGLLLLVLALRAVLLPLSFAAQRSAFRSGRAAAAVASVRERFAGDPAARKRALREAYRAHGIRPAVTVLSIALQLLVLIAAFRVVTESKDFRGAGFVPGWLDDLSAPDRTWVLPGLVGLVAAALMSVGAQGRLWKRLAVPGATGILLAILVAPLRSAVGLFLAASVGFAVLEKSVAFALERRRLGRIHPPSPEPAGGTVREPQVEILPLARAATAEGVGGKARNLAKLKEAGFPVPDGFVLPPSFFGEAAPSPWTASETQLRALREAFRVLDSPRVAVRSSGLREDGSKSSYAGVFESVLDVEGSRLPEAIGLVVDSFRSDRTRAYGEESPPCVLVQRMVDAEWAGVVFTTHPMDPAALLIEATRGCGADLVQGRLNPQRLVLDRETLALESDSSPLPVSELARLAMRIEAHFKRPQDIEWAMAGGQTVVLQSRDITIEPIAADRETLLQREGRRLRARAGDRPSEAIVWKGTALTEDLPRPTALSLSLMRALWSFEGAVGLAFRRLGLPYDARVRPEEVIETVYGGLRVDPDAEARLFRGRAGWLSSWRIERLRRRFEGEFQGVVAPRVEEYVEQEAKADLPGMSDPSLFAAARRRWRTFVSDHYVEAEIVNILADYSHRAVERAIEGTGISSAAFLEGKAPGAFARANALIADVAERRALLADYLDRFGHRAEVDYELAAPRFREEPERVVRLIAAWQALKAKNGFGAKGDANGNGRPANDPASDLPRRFVASLGRVRRRLLEENVAFLRSYETLKEDAKDLLLREVALLRAVFLEIGRRRGLGEDVFHLTLEEALALEDPRSNFSSRAVARRACREAFALLDVPASVALRDLDRLTAHASGEPAREAESNGRLAGLLVSGNRTARGRARVVRSIEDLSSFQPGEILVASFTEPAWSIVFPRAGGVVTEVGGALCHTAILAREYGLVAVVGVEGATKRIRTGDRLRIYPDGAVFLEEEPRPGDGVPVPFVWEGRGSADASAHGEASHVAPTSPGPTAAVG